MPGLDGTGPAGRGPASGRGLGYCGEFQLRAGGYRGGGYGRGPGWGRGYGGPRHRWYGGPGPNYRPAWSDSVDEKDFLQNQTEQLKAELAALEKRMAEMENE